MKFTKRITLMVGLLCLLAVIAFSICVVKFVSWQIAKKDFYNAIEINDIDNVRSLLEEYPSLVNSTRDPVLGFMLHFFMDYREANALTCALHSHVDVELIKLLVENGADVNRHPFGNGEDYPLLLALRLGEYDVAQYFIEQGADLHVRTQKETTPYNLLYIDDFDGANKEVQYQLFLRMIEQDVSLEPPLRGDFQGAPFLHLACRNTYILEYLLTLPEIEVDVNAINDFDAAKMTALMMAICRQDYDVCEILLAHGADITIKSQEGKSAYDYAAELEDPILIQMLTK